MAALNEAPNSLGLHVIWPTSESSISDKQHDIVFIHGLGYGSASDWQDVETGSLWPRDFLPHDIESCRILLFGYPSEQVVGHGQEAASIFKFAENLCNDLADNKAAKNHTLTFVAHGVGGLIVKKALCYSYSRKTMYGFVLQRLKHVMFLDTPHSGIDGDFLANQWTLWSDELDLLAKEFSPIASRYHITSVFSDTPTAGVDNSKPRSLNTPSERVFTVDLKDNATISKYPHRDDHNYKRLLKRIQNSLQLFTQDPDDFDIIERWIDGRKEALDTEIQEELVNKRFRNSFDWFFKTSGFLAWCKDRSSDPSLWLTAPSGCGKSVLCSLVYRELDDPSRRPRQVVACLYITKTVRRYLSFLKSLAIQLLDQLKCLSGIDTELLQYTRKTRLSADNLQGLIKSLILASPKVYILIDGIDEIRDIGSDRSEAESMELSIRRLVTFVQGLTIDQITGRDTHVRVWCSSQDCDLTHQLMEKFKYVKLNEDEMNTDVQEFVTVFLKRILKQSHQTSAEKFFTKASMLLGAEANFRWASMMHETLSGCEKDDKLLEETMRGLPRPLSRIYELQMERFQRLDDADGSHLSRNILSMVTYARRPLSARSLQEAISVLCLKSDERNHENLSPRATVHLGKLTHRCAPLVEYFTRGPHGDGYLRLSHSSVYKFLKKQNSGFAEDNGSFALHFEVLEESIAVACLRYLAQKRYAGLLEKRSPREFVTRTGPAPHNVAQHEFLQYAAKYWYRHSEALASPDRVRHFVSLPQFVTLIQIQSLFIKGHFMQRKRGEKILTKKNLPECLVSTKEPSLFLGYNRFVAEWGHFLQQGITNHMNGEIDRCFFGALGTNNFLYAQKAIERYQSFRLEVNTLPRAATNEALSCHYQTVSRDGTKLSIWRVLAAPSDRPQSLKTVILQREAWYIDGRSSPCQYLTEHIDVSKDATNWDLYDPRKTLKFTAVPSMETTYRPNLIEGCHDACWLRIGSSEFFRYQDRWEEADRCSRDVQSRAFWDHIVRRQPYVVKCRRQLYQNTPSNDIKAHDADDWESETVSDVASSAANYESDSSSAEDSIRGVSSKTESSSGVSVLDGMAFHDGSAVSEAETDEVNTDTMSRGTGGSASRLTSVGSGSLASENPSGPTKEEINEEPARTVRWVENVVSSISLDSKARCDVNLDIQPEKQDHDQEDEDQEVPVEFGYESDDSCIGLVDTQPMISNESHPFKFRCDRCGAGHLIRFLQCRICIPGNTFDICLQCSENGKWCLNKKHQLRRVSFNFTKREFVTETLCSIDTSVRGTYIKVHREGCDGRVAVFKFSNLVSQSLYDSPPCIHPKKPLLVFAISSTKILVAAIESNSYFIQDLPLPCEKSHNIGISQVQMQFSTSEEYLHIARLGFATTSQGLPLAMYFELLTYGVSQEPSLARRLKYITGRHLITGSWTHKFVSGLPFHLTWTPSHLYVSSSGHKLQVLRVALGPTEDGLVETVEGSVILPKSASKRSVQFFPALESDLNATIIIGCQQDRLMDPPIIVYLTPRDIGGWNPISTSDEYSSPVRLQPREDVNDDWDSDSDCDLILYQPESDR